MTASIASAEVAASPTNCGAAIGTMIVKRDPLPKDEVVLGLKYFLSRRPADCKLYALGPERTYRRTRFYLPQAGAPRAAAPFKTVSFFTRSAINDSEGNHADNIQKRYTEAGRRIRKVGQMHATVASRRLAWPRIYLGRFHHENPVREGGSFWRAAVRHTSSVASVWC